MFGVTVHHLHASFKAVFRVLEQFTILHVYIIIYYYYYYLESAVQGRERVRLSVQRPQPHTTNPWKEEKDKTVGYKKERTDHANMKALALNLKPASPTPSNTGSLRSFQRGTEGSTKLLRYL